MKVYHRQFNYGKHTDTPLFFLTGTIFVHYTDFYLNLRHINGQSHVEFLEKNNAYANQYVFNIATSFSVPDDYGWMQAT